MADSQITKGIGGTNVDSPRFKWDYSAGVGLKSLLDLYELTGEKKYNDYVLSFADKVVAEDGTIKSYNVEEYNIDRVNTSKIFFRIYDQTGEGKYKQALDLTRTQFEGHPRNEDGGLWHKEIYPHQMWLDGIYMASPFMAQYGAEFDKPEWIAEAVKQVTLCHDHTLDAATGLYHHAWDESRSQRWADPVTGHSPCFWGRSMGWYFMALVDCLDFIPQEDEAYARIAGYVRELAAVLPRWQDADGLWYQVVDCPERDGNFPEASVTAQFMYAYAKAINKGILDADTFAFIPLRALQGLRNRLIVENADGTLTLTRCCQVGGLGGNPYRDGSFDYYIHEKIRDNDAKATGPFIMGCLEIAKFEN